MVQSECAETTIMESLPAAADAADEALARQAAGGDRAALEKLLERHGPTAMRAAFAVLRREDFACEAAQTALIYVSRHMSAAWNGGSFRAWVAVSAQRAAINLLKSETNRARKEQLAVLGAGRAGPQESNMTAAEKSELYAMVHEELANEPEETVAALVLHHVQGLPISEVAAECKIGFEACKKRLSRGRENLRARLERRGVTPAALAVLPAVLDGLTRDAVGLNVQTATVSKMVEGALRACKVPAASHAAHGAALGLKLAIAGGLLSVAALATFAIHGFGAQTQRPVPAGGPPFTKGDVTASGAQEAGPAHWQQPRIISIDGVSVWPSSLSANGQHVAIFAQIQKNLAAKTAAELVKDAVSALICSDDGGQSWRVDEIKVDRFAGESIAIDSKGACALLTADLTPEGMKSFATRADAIFEGRHQWYTFTPEAGVSGPQSSWPRDEWLFASRLAAVSEGTWAFTQLGVGRKTLVAAYGAAGKCPEILPPIEYPQEIDTPVAAAWAADAKTAGFVGTSHDSFDGDQLDHYKTLDAGRSWQHQPVEFKPAQADAPIPDKLLVLAVAREQKRLVLLVKAMYKPDGMFQIFMLTSADLGDHWGAPVPVSKLHPRNGGDNASGLRYLHLTQGQIGIGWSDHKTTFAVLSSDDGATWRRYGGFAAAGVAAGPFAIGGDPRSLHIAIGKNDPSGKCYLVIQSFAPGDWKDAQPAPPDWFKSGKLDKAEQNDF
jgi:RNA polymerase sigma factor (sigma-70 family)